MYFCCIYPPDVCLSFSYFKGDVHIRTFAVNEISIEFFGFFSFENATLTARRTMVHTFPLLLHKLSTQILLLSFQALGIAQASLTFVFLLDFVFLCRDSA